MTGGAQLQSGPEIFACLNPLLKFHPISAGWKWLPSMESDWSTAECLELALTARPVQRTSTNNQRHVRFDSNPSSKLKQGLESPHIHARMKMVGGTSVISPLVSAGAGKSFENQQQPRSCTVSNFSFRWWTLEEVPWSLKLWGQAV